MDNTKPVACDNPTLPGHNQCFNNAAHAAAYCFAAFAAAQRRHPAAADYRTDAVLNDFNPFVWAA